MKPVDEVSEHERAQRTRALRQSQESRLGFGLRTF